MLSGYLVVDCIPYTVMCMTMMYQARLLVAKHLTHDKVTLDNISTG